MFAFCKLIPAPLHSKLLGVSPPPSTLSDLVEKAREFNRNWCMFSSPKPHSGTRNPQVQEIQAEEKLPSTEINAIGKKLLKQHRQLTPQEQKYWMDKNLCLYCSEAGHKASTCTKPPNHKPGTTLQSMDTITEEDQGSVYPVNKAKIGALSMNSFTPEDYIKDSTMTDSF